MHGRTGGALRFLFADHLSRSISSLEGLDVEGDVVLLVEVADEATYVPHHKKKIAFLFSAMRHFAEELRAAGIRVDYVRLDDAGNTGSFRGELRRALARHRPQKVVVAEPGEYRVLDDMLGWQDALGVAVEIRPDTRFFCSRDQFARWADGRKQLRMELFYRAMRKRHGMLLQRDNEPEGGRWNFDADNRKPPPHGLEPPQPLHFPPDATTREVLALVARRFPAHFGDLEPFWFAVTAADARRAFAHFVRTRLAGFGAYQDAMLQGEDHLFHAAISQYLNCGLLLPRDVCRAAERAWRAGAVPLNSAEGFIRQILGWREYVRGVYWLKMPYYAELNHLDARRDIPDFYWSGKTEMNCLAQVIDQTRREALSHHIQRLMVSGNFALLIGVRPEHINLWYLVVYADAFEWVELPNTHGMAMFADGGFLASKPYAASGNYINRMSDFCKRCHYDVTRRSGERACPFNYLYWDFLMRNRAKLARVPRLQQVYRTLDRMPKERREAIAADAGRFLDRLEPWRAPAPAESAPAQ
jgi:deoxyribodipyrimidine photolyase-related protein